MNTVPIPVDQAEQSFKDMLVQAGVQLSHPNVLEIWSVFKAFARLTVDCARDGLLFETLYLAERPPYRTRASFLFHFLRQFELEEDGDYVGMEQLDCSFTFPPYDDLEPLQVTLWSFDFPTLDAYFNHVESRPAFRIPTSRYTPSAVDIVQDQV